MIKYEKRIIMLYQTPPSFAWLFPRGQQAQLPPAAVRQAIFKTSSSITHLLVMEDTTYIDGLVGESIAKGLGTA